MVKINKIYTKVGDKGETYLIGGKVVCKHDIRIEVCGGLDELCSQLGLVRTIAANTKQTSIEDKLSHIQNLLFDIGAEIATPAESKWQPSALVSMDHTATLEGWIDSYTEQLPELNSFVLPGGSELNATINIARSVCRRVERRLTELHQTEPLRSEVLMFINRLSDFLFAAARAELVLKGGKEYLWQPGNKL